MSGYWRLTLIVMLALLASCSVFERAAITSPAAGAVISGEVIPISGTLSGMDKVDIHVVTADDVIVAEWTIRQGGNWTVGLMHEYSGAPVEATIYLLPHDPNKLNTEMENPHDTVTITLEP